MIRVRPRQGALAIWRRQPPNFVDVEDNDAWLPPAQRVWLESEQSVSTSVDQVADRYAVPLKQVWSQRSARSQQKRTNDTSQQEGSKDRSPDAEASVEGAGLDESRMSAELRVGELEHMLREEVMAREKAEQALRDAQKELHAKVSVTARQCELQARQIASQQAALRELRAKSPRPKERAASAKPAPRPPSKPRPNTARPEPRARPSPSAVSRLAVSKQQAHDAVWRAEKLASEQKTWADHGSGSRPASSSKPPKFQAKSRARSAQVIVGIFIHEVSLAWDDYERETNFKDL
jgi:hypothetical protein